MLPRLPGKRLLFRLNAAPVHANHANRASAFAVSRIIDPSRLADPQAFVNPDYFTSDSTKPDYALILMRRHRVASYSMHDGLIVRWWERHRAKDIFVREYRRQVGVDPT